VCAAGVHIARYKWPTKEAAPVVTGSLVDGAAVANGEGGGRGGRQQGHVPPQSPRGERAFGEARGGTAPRPAKVVSLFLRS